MDTILYLASNHDVLHVLAVELRGVKKTIGLALSDDFRRDLLETQVLNVNGNRSAVAFRELFPAFDVSAKTAERKTVGAV